jgi:hypothetical protein
MTPKPFLKKEHLQPPSRIFCRHEGKELAAANPIPVIR